MSSGQVQPWANDRPDEEGCNNKSVDSLQTDVTIDEKQQQIDEKIR